MEIGYKSEKYLHYIMRKIIKRFKVGPKKQQVKLKKLFFIENFKPLSFISAVFNII